jgi:hypothetical protein
VSECDLETSTVARPMPARAVEPRKCKKIVVVGCFSLTLVKNCIEVEQSMLF